MLTSGLAQIGWADPSFESSSASDEGVRGVTAGVAGVAASTIVGVSIDAGIHPVVDQIGDNGSSWAFDGARQQKWNGPEPSPYGIKWNSGDVVRAARASVFGWRLCGQR
jgi:hypothetical protein